MKLEAPLEGETEPFRVVEPHDVDRAYSAFCDQHMLPCGTPQHHMLNTELMIQALMKLRQYWDGQVCPRCPTCNGRISDH